MKKISNLLLGVIFIAFITGSIQSASADHLEPGQGIFKNEKKLNNTPIEGTKYQIYIQTVLRNGDGQLINVSGSTRGAFIPHEITEYTFDTLLGKKEIITIDNIKYEKVQYTNTPALENRFASFFPIFNDISFKLEIGTDVVTLMHSITKDYPGWQIHYCTAIKGHGDICIPVFQVLVPMMAIGPDDVITLHWTILRELN